jgi:hypothetical protein
MHSSHNPSFDRRSLFRSMWKWGVPVAAGFQGDAGGQLASKKAASYVNVLDFEGADPTGGTDSTTALRAAARAIPDGGGALLMPQGRYQISDSVLLKSGTRVFSFGGATIFTLGMREMTKPVHPPESFLGAAFGNMNFAAKTTLDSDFSIENITFDWGDNPGSNSAVLRFISAKRVKIRDCTFRGQRYGDAIAFIGCQDLTVENCYAEGFTNCGLDTWNGCSRIRFINNTLVTGADCVQVININGVNDYGGDGVADDFEVRGNRIIISRCAATAIFLATLGQKSAVRNGTISQNSILGDEKRGGYGIVARGLGGRLVISDNRLSRLGPASPIWIDTGFYDGKIATTAANCIVVNNVIADCNITAGPFDGRAAAAIALTGDGHYCAGNEVVGGSYQWIVWSNGKRVIVGPNSGSTGTMGRYGDDGFHLPMVLDANIDRNEWIIEGLLRAGGGVILSRVPTSPGGLQAGTIWSDRGTLRIAP